MVLLENRRGKFYSAVNANKVWETVPLSFIVMFHNVIQSSNEQLLPVQGPNGPNGRGMCWMCRNVEQFDNLIFVYLLAFFVACCDCDKFYTVLCILLVATEIKQTIRNYKTRLIALIRLRS